MGVSRHDRTDARTVPRNGRRPWALPTAAGDLELAISKLRLGCSCYCGWRAIASSAFVETHDEWQVSDLGYLPEGSMPHLNAPMTGTSDVRTGIVVAAPELITLRADQHHR